MRKIATVKVVESGVERTLRAYATVGMTDEEDVENKAVNKLQLFTNESMGSCYKTIDMQSADFVSVEWE